MRADQIIRMGFRMLTGKDAPRLPRTRGRRPRPTWLPPGEWSREFIASNEFLRTWQWRKVRYRRLEQSDGRCDLCGRSRKDGIILNVDHIWNRLHHPELCLTVEATQCLCGPCNAGKGNESTRDWR